MSLVDLLKKSFYKSNLINGDTGKYYLPQIYVVRLSLDHGPLDHILRH